MASLLGMGGMFLEISNRQAYYLLLMVRGCITNKENCDKDCSKCKFSLPGNAAEDGLSYAIKILKARDPMLYLQDEIQDLKEMLEAKQNV